MTKLPKSKDTPQVALLVETSTSWGSQIVKGISNYAQENGGWFFFIEPRGRYEPVSMPPNWSGDGVIARVTSLKLAKELEAAKIPTVNVSWFEYQNPLMARCTSDEVAVGRMSARYFTELGLQHYGYFGPLYRPGYVDGVKSSFLQEIEKAGHQCFVYDPPRKKKTANQWIQTMQQMSYWIEQLPKPIGILAWNSTRARQVTDACRYANINVPHEVAVLGGERDDLMDQISNPPLSSIDVSAVQVGYQSAKLLHKIIQGKNIPLEPVLVPPNSIIERQSTETLAVDDSEVATAVQFIRDHYAEDIQVSDIVNYLNISKRIMEKRFIKALGVSPAAEIRRVRLRQAKQLLRTTKNPLPQIARACGFNEPSSFSRTFRKETGITPSEYRKQNQ